MSIVATEQSKSITAANQRWVLTGLNYSTLGFSVAGTISAGNLTVEVSVDGYTWQAVDVFQNKTALGSGQVTAAGTYRSDIAGYSQVSILASSLFSGSVVVFADPSPAIISTSATGGTSLTYTLPLDLTGDTVSLLGISALGTARQGMFMNAGATALEWVSSNGTGNIVRATGAAIGTATLTAPSVATSLTLSYATVSVPVIVNGAGLLVSATQSGTGTTFAMTASPTFTGTVTGAIGVWSGYTDHGARIFFSADDPAGVYSVGRSATLGLEIRGGTGSTYDLTLRSRDGSTVCGILPGSSNFEFTAGVNFASTISVGGVPGVTAGPFTAVTGITVVNGIVTALTGT